MRRLVALAAPAAVFLVAFAGFIGCWVAAFMLANRFGFDNQATPQYGFTSGVGTMLLTSLGLSTIITGLWRTHNCHAEGCPRIGRHKVNGTPWCNEHHGYARTAKSTDDLLRELIEVLRAAR